MNVSRKTSFAMGAIMALVLGSGTAYAATGGDLLIGRYNHASKKTVLINHEGTALVLKSHEGKPPFKVNRRVKVPRLNADEVDGRSEWEFALASGGFGTITAKGDGSDSDFNGIPEQITAVATCPSGTHRTGGGVTDLNDNTILFVSAPSGENAWIAVTLNDNTDINTTENNLSSFAVCYNPRGSVTSVTTRTTRSDILKQVSPALRRKIDAKVANR